MTTYQDLPNELRENIFLKSINSLQDLQKICKVNVQNKMYCDKYFTLPIAPILKEIIEIINNLGFDEKTFNITIYTNQQFKKTIIKKKNNNTHIYTNFKYKQILNDIIININTQNKYNYNNFSNFHRKDVYEITVYSRDQSKSDDKDRVIISIN
jgi:hypothetical protein